MRGAGLLFVYNADGGVVERTLDYLHKLSSPSTYACSLCALTYGPLGMRSRWRDFVERQPYKVRFLHRDEFIREHKELADLGLPAVLTTTPGSPPRPVLTPGELNRLHSLDELERLIREVAERELLSEPRPRA